MLGNIKRRVRPSVLIAGTAGLMLASVTVLVSLSSTAEAATNVTCGQVITASITVNNNLTCDRTGLYIGAAGITLNLGGHTISLSATPATGVSMGIDDHGFANVTITNGTIRGFDLGVYVESGATGVHIQNVRAFKTGLDLRANGAVVSGNVVSGASRGINVVSSSNTISGNTLGGNATGIYVEGASNAITGNRVASSSGNGIEVANAASATKVTNNVVTAGSQNGIVVNDITATITGNTSNFNALYGIAGSYGPVDGGSNKARDNSQAKQCTIVTCL